MQVLRDAYNGLARHGQPHLVTVYAPPGGGKSRLTSELFDGIGHTRVRSGRCLPYGEGITYYPVQLIIRADAGIEIDEPRESAIAKLHAVAREAFGDDVEDADAVARRISVLAGMQRAEDVLPEVEPHDLRDELAFGLRRYLERRTGNGPLVLVFEDIHWAEPGLLDLVENLAEWARAPLMLLCLARPDFREQRPTWGGSATNATSMSLSPLTANETRRLIAELLDIDDLPEQVRAEVVTRAEGIPLYVEEFLRLLMETGRVEKRGERWVAIGTISGSEVPPTLQGLITARLDRVSPEVKALLQRGSLAGRLFSTDALTALADGVKPDPALLRDAIRRDLLVEADERAPGAGRVFRFKHVLIRDVAYSTVPKAERSRLHDRYGRWLEASLGDRHHEIADIIAFHAEQAFLLAHELNLSGSADLGRRAFDLLLEAARSAFEREDLHGALSLYQRAGVVGDSTGTTPTERAEILGRTLLARDGLGTERPDLSELDDVIGVARDAAPNVVLPQLLAWRAERTRSTEGPGVARALVESAVDAARETGDADLITEAMFDLSFHHYYVNDIEGMRRVLLEAREHIYRTGSKRAGGKVLFWLGVVAVFRGDLTERQALTEEAIARLPGRSKFYRAIEHVARAWYAMDIGDHQRQLEEFREALALFRALGQPSFIAQNLWGIGEALLWLGDPARARDALAEAVDLFVRRGQRGQIPEVRARLGRALLRLGDTASARAQAEEARAVADPTDIESRFIAAIAVGEVREAEGDLAAAEAMFREAVAVTEPTGMGDSLAEAREHYARFLLRHGRSAEARPLLEAVRAFWHDPLAELHRQRIDALLAQTFR